MTWRINLNTSICWLHIHPSVNQASKALMLILHCLGSFPIEISTHCFIAAPPLVTRPLNHPSSAPSDEETSHLSRQVKSWKCISTGAAEWTEAARCTAVTPRPPLFFGTASFLWPTTWVSLSRRRNSDAIDCRWRSSWNHWCNCLNVNKSSKKSHV